MGFKILPGLCISTSEDKEENNVMLADTNALLL